MFVLAKGGEPLMPCHPARARELLGSGRAVVARRAPFTIRLKDRSRAGSAVAGVQLRLDPGSKATGIAVTDERDEVGPKGRTALVRRGLVSIELRHRGRQIHSGMVLNIEHVRPRSRGGSDRVADLVIACVPCNQAKGTARIDEFLADRPARLERVIAQLQRPLHDVAAMNTTRLLLVKTLATHGVAVHTWSGGRTSWNRLAMGLPKSHTLDAPATGVIDLERGDAVVRVPAQILVVRSTGRGSYARTTPDRYGFPRLQRPRRKIHHGFSTGDLVAAVVPKGKWAGRWVGRVSVRAGGQHRITTLTSRFDVSHRNLRLLQRADGYTYGFADEIRLSEERGPAYSGRTLKGGDPGNVRTPDA
ncbi:RRXRR domain-containing protein [Streptomyces virginiae]|uniref:RRXRR domain-containing protein n=1 Tax=Streptomyces virginiae TaxID=1961 RepID=UPI0037FA2D34